ncbi:HNH endonuclease [Pseudomonas guariconensis]|uniref:HNH endonuclease n=1 Tax=Pseudomonas guariconensis TaxID=1288410 RepID=UPI003905B5F7
MARLKVGAQTFVAAYEAAKQVLAGHVKLTAAERQLCAEFGLGDRTGSGYIGCYLAMRKGKLFKTIVGADGLRFMLDRIAEGGPGDLVVALDSVMRHILYLEGNKGRKSGLRRVHTDYVARLRDMAELDESSLSLDARVAAALADPESLRAERLRQADALPAQHVVMVRVFKRNPDVIAQALLAAKGVCQGCKLAAPFLRADGRPYLEVHHRRPLADGGEDTVENAIALCPNCHRERHYGARYRAPHQ